LAGDFERARDVPVLCDDGGPLGLSVVSAALAATYSGETPAPELLNQLHARSSPSRKAWYEYIAGELDGRATSWDSAESHYQAALRLASVGGATFIEGIALVGLASVQAARGEANTALAGYRELLTYWERTASWTFQATTLRNLAALLAKLGATEVARFLWAAADGEPEHGPPTFDDEHLRREHVLRVAREAIDRHLQQQACTAGIAAATPHPWQHLREPAREG
jgi:tetratricopeptide (TPR) repeat protein